MSDNKEGMELLSQLLNKQMSREFTDIKSELMQEIEKFKNEIEQDSAFINGETLKMVGNAKNIGERFDNELKTFSNKINQKIDSLENTITSNVETYIKEYILKILEENIERKIKELINFKNLIKLLFNREK